MTKTRKPKVKPTLVIPLISKLAASRTLNDENESHNGHWDRYRGLHLQRDIFLAARRSGPETPTPFWKLDENPSHEGCGGGRRKACGNNNRNRNGNVNAVVSARKLAASLRELQQSRASKRSEKENGASAPISSGVHGPPKVCAGRHLFQTINAYARIPCSCKCVTMSSNSYVLQRWKDGRISLPTSALNNGRCLEIDSVKESAAMEKATKWDTGCTKTSDDVFRVYSHIKTLEEQQNTSISVVSVLQTELDKARLRVQELELAQRASQKEIDHFLKKIAEERILWRNTQQERIRAMIQTIKEELNTERKAKQRMEMVNGKLVKELAEAKMTIMRSLQDLEKERKAKRLMEDICDELAREIGEDKAEVEELKRESMKIREEVEEERKMLQMAEVWREERVQMKLVEAKLALEEKSSALDKLRRDLEAFMNSKIASGNVGVAPDVAAHMQDAELLREATSSKHIQEIKELSYQPPTPDDVFFAFDDLHSTRVLETADAKSGRDLGDGCYTPCPRSHASKILTVSPEVHGFDKNFRRSYSEVNIVEDERDEYVEEDEDKRKEEVEEEDSEWDYASRGDEQVSSDASSETKPSVNGGEADSSFSETGTDWEGRQDSAIVITEIEPYPATGEQLRVKNSSTGQTQRSNGSKGEFNKTISMENNFPINTKKISMTSPGQQSVDRVCSPPNVGPWSSPDVGNPHIARGIKGFIEWPKGVQKNSLKARLLEAKMESQKLQLRHVLKQKH